MRKKPELLVTAGSIEEMIPLLDAGADAIAIGEQKFGMRLPGDFSMDQVAQAIELAHQRQAKVYVVMNAIMDNEILDELPDYIRFLAKAKADAIVYGDPALLMAMKQADVQLPLHWNTEMTSTNYVTANYWASKGAVRVVVARELNMDQVLEMKRNVHMEVQVQVHGATNIFHSKRKMVSNYRTHQGRQFIPSENDLDKGLFLIEAERRDEKYPIYEDRNGTHIMSSEDICMLENLHELIEGNIDSLKIEGLLKPLEYNVAAVHAYRQAIDAYVSNPEEYVFDPAWLKPIERLQPKDRHLSFGFFYKEQVY